MDIFTDDCFIYGKERDLFGPDRQEVEETNIENAEDCQFKCQEKYTKISRGTFPLQ